MAAKDDTTHAFGISVPPLVDYLKTILREYSDGQILKELVQNAEDAGADTVKFLYDVRQYGTKELYLPSLKPYQGPALYSFNNAKFKDTDWDGIQKPARSNKKTNLLKVGRFGIGFSSVYHITDLPSIMSDQTLAFIDPLEEHFKDKKGRPKTGWRFDLSHGANKQTFLKFSDQFKPYHNLFQGMPGGISEGKYDGTLFRFPLRSTASELSVKTYTDECKIDELLQAFQVDADVVMLFLRSLNNIEVLKRSCDQQEPSLLVRVKKDHSGELGESTMDRNDLSSRLESYCSDVSGCREPIEMTDSVTFSTEKQGVSKRQHWVVSHFIAGDGTSKELSDMADAQHHLPWSAVALPLSSQEQSDEVNNGQDNDFGRVFCFLPLPPGEESQTGLPVHVHGFFSVNSDRRGIKWPGPDQTDTSAQWNRIIVTKLLPVVYVNAIKYIIGMSKFQDSITPDCIYRTWPDEKKVQGNWNVLLEPFYEALFDEAIIHSDNGWLKIGDVFLNELTVGEDMEKAILKCFKMSGSPCAKVPNVCRQAIKKFYKHNTTTISASRLCCCLREDPSILTGFNTEEKLHILEFILGEDAGQDLEGLPLLPLDDDSFTFFSGSRDPVYIPTSKFHRQLIPGGYEKFVKAMPEKETLCKLLSKLDGHYQLKSLTLDEVALLLKANRKCWTDAKGTWKQDSRGPPLQVWLKAIWEMLYRESPSKLLLFEGVYLVPLLDADGGSQQLLPLCQKSIVIQRRHKRSERYPTLDEALENALRKIGVTVTECPDYVLSHSAFMRDEYIKLPTPEGILKCLLLSDVNFLTREILSFSPSDRVIVVKCLAEASLTQEGRNLLKRLPLFEPVAGTGNSTSPVRADQCKGYIDVQEDEIPNPLKLTVLLISGRDCFKNLLQKLQVRRISKYEVIEEVIGNISNERSYSVAERKDAMLWIMKRWGEVKINCPLNIDILCQLKFIPTANPFLLSPSQLLDPRDQVLVSLFDQEGAFPVKPFDSESLLSALHDLGMRGQSDVSDVEIFSCVDRIEKSQSQSKAREFLKFLSKNQSLLRKSVSNYMENKQCLPHSQSEPEYYPSAISWLGSSSHSLSTPQETLRETKQAVLISGGTKLFVNLEDEHRFPMVFSKLGIGSSCTPTVTDVITQLEMCVRYTEDKKGQDVTDIIPMLKEIYAFLSEAWHTDVQVTNLILERVKRCIWNGSGFSEPSKMCTSGLPFDLAPYMASIPKEICTVVDFLEVLGVKKNINTNPDALVDILQEVKRSCEVPGLNADFYQRQHRLVMEILHHLHAGGEMSEEAHRRLLVPAQGKECLLTPVGESAYIDKDWLRQGSNNEDLEDEEGFILIHSDVSMELAKFLQVRPVSQLLLDSEELGEFIQTGQHEPLTMRLANILKNNYQDTSIVQEMIQNAEDAGAKEVRFLIDMRHNKSANEKLFDPGMKSCQGPALWVFNDAVFTDGDFDNILRLGGRTKEKDTEKIGKFGTGFNSVYHITDVPSFVSREYMQFFDPNTTYLGNVLANKSQPGVRIKLNSNKQVRRFPDQFKPFDGVFGLDFGRETESICYQGTLFRLPLRSKEAAQKSDICRESYDLVKLTRLLQHTWESSRNLLVFTRKVKTVSFFFLDEHSQNPVKAEELFTIQKTCNSPRVNDDMTAISTEKFHRKMTSKGAQILSQTEEITTCKQTFEIIKVTCETSKQAAELANSTTGNERGLSPQGAVAFPFHATSAPKGEMYCFLPLSINSTLPVHINGSFAVKEDRRSLHKPVPNSPSICEKWNYVLLADVICRAYISLMSNKEFIQQVKQCYGSEVTPEHFWPDVDDVPKNSECSALFDAFYNAIVYGLDGSEPELFWKDGKAYQFKKVVFLGQDIQREKLISGLVMSILNEHLPMEVIELSDKTWRALKRVGLYSDVIKRTYCLDRFFDEVFLPHLHQVPENMRNKLVLFALKSAQEKLKLKLKDVKCIPVFRGRELRKPGELIHPKGAAAPMYSESDKTFPFGKEFNSVDTLAILSQLGMITEVSEDAFVERCNTVTILQSNNAEIAKKRCHAVLKYLSRRLDDDWGSKQHLREMLRKIPFLPVLCKGNRDQALPWMEMDNQEDYTSAYGVYSHSQKYLVSSIANVVDESKRWKLPMNVTEFLGLSDKQPSEEEVLTQFSNFRNHYKTRRNISNSRLETICKKIYRYIDTMCASKCPLIDKALKKDQCFLVDSQFVCASVIATRGGEGLMPFLCTPTHFLRQFPHLLEHAELKEHFNARDYKGVLRTIYEDNIGQALDSKILDIAILAASRLSSSTDDCNQPPDVFLPDENNCMRPVSELCYCDVDWVEDERNELHKCHKKISFADAMKLEVKDIRQQMLKQYDIDLPGEDFGQHEKLITRIKRLLESYPSDETILKELLQNADDAGATEIHIVHDPRKHNTRKILGDGMKSLQGPALCVFNNQSFKEDDIRGIQNLGEGSKGSNMGKIGRYGVGFNAVYQLTDCPSFISQGKKLCMFDPLIKHVPGATNARPGRLIKIDDRVRSLYQDVFPCYLEKELADGQDNFTVFRLPLRTEASELSTNVWTPGKIRKLLIDFERAAFESLLFLKNVTKISISKVTGSGRVGSTRTICAEMTENYAGEKKQFFQKVASLRDGNMEPEPEEVVYKMKVKGIGKQEDWVICQRLGSKDSRVLKSMQTYKLLPVGGVAACLTDRKEELTGKAYCFLPLPIETGFPVHIHGYFALDHESRRHLWEGNQQDEQTRWNSHISENVIAPAYVTLLLWIQKFLVQNQGWSGLVPYEQIHCTYKPLEKYHNFFPRVDDSAPYWTRLEHGVYRIVAGKALTLFPSIHREGDRGNQFFLQWKSPMKSNDPSISGYFNTLSSQLKDFAPGMTRSLRTKKESDSHTLKTTLVQITYPLLESPVWIMNRLRACKKANSESLKMPSEVLEVSPQSVIAFLRGDNPLKMKLPVPIAESKMCDMKSLQCLLQYCRELLCSRNLHGLPLLLTGDGVLRTFSRDKPVFMSKFCNLFEPLSHKFVDFRLLGTLPTEADVFHKLDVTAVSMLLYQSKQYLKCESKEVIQLERHIPSTWFQGLWRLLESFCNEKREHAITADKVRHMLGHWAILPVTQIQPRHQMPSESEAVEFVAPISLSFSIIIEPDKVDKRLWPIFPALESLQVFKIEDEALSYQGRHNRLLRNLLAHRDEPSRVLDVLMYWVDRDVNKFKHLKSPQHEDILKYFPTNDDSIDWEKLRSIPCYQTIGGNFVSISGYDTVLVLPSEIPKKEQDQWIPNAIFLQYNHHLVNLYKKLGLSDTTEINVYAKYIIPAFDRLSEESRIEHLVRLKQLLQYENNRKDIITRLGLRDLRFITGTTGEMMSASDFFDPEVELFSLMLTRDDYPPDHVRRQLGLDFLREIGLQVVITKDLFLSFARQVKQPSRNAQITKQKSILLVSELQRCELHKDSTFLKQVSEINFLVSDGINKEMKYIHLPVAKKGTLMNYSESISSTHSKLVWSTKRMLPDYANHPNKCQHCSKSINDELGVASEPKLMSVIKHTQNICSNLQKKKKRKLLFPQELANVLREILDFMSLKCAGQTCEPDQPCQNCCIIQCELKSVHIVFIELEEEHILVTAKEISRTLRDNLEPFLYQLPDRWVPYINILRILEGTLEPTTQQYMLVLKSIFDRGHGAWSNPNVIRIIEKATFGLYEALSKGDVACLESSGDCLYLPSCKGTMAPSNLLLLNNVNLYSDRLRKSNLLFLKIFKEHEKTSREAFGKLPENIAPRKVSTEVKEVLNKDGADSHVCLMNGDEQCQFELQLQRLLQSKEFATAVCSIMKHYKHKMDENDEQRFKDQLSGLKITCMQQLYTVLQIDSQDIEGSEKEVHSYMSGDTELYVRHSDGQHRSETFVHVAIHVNQLLGNALESREYLVALLSQESPATIQKTLVNYGINTESTGDTSFQLPDPGTTFPDKLYHLLEQNPWTSFREDDYVAYSKADGEDEFYVYARIVKRLRNESLRTVFHIDVGAVSPIEASVLDIYKIHIPRHISGMELDETADSEKDGSAGHQELALPIDVEAAKSQVTEELEKIWPLPEELRRKALRRLMLKWHPDKHPEGPQEVFNEAFRHLQNEITRLLKDSHVKAARTTRRGNISKSGNQGRTCYEDIIRAANQRARADLERYTRFGGFSSGYKRGGKGSGSWSSGSQSGNFYEFFTRNSLGPDNRNARRWLRQGQEDLRAAHHDLNPHDEPSLEWVAFKCHQSTEKALKAAQLAIRGKYDTTHNIVSLAFTVSTHLKNSSEILEHVKQLNSLVQDQKARYPDRCAFSEIPHEAFRNKEEVDQMMAHTKAINEVVHNFLS